MTINKCDNRLQMPQQQQQLQVNVPLLNKSLQHMASSPFSTTGGMTVYGSSSSGVPEGGHGARETPRPRQDDCERQNQAVHDDNTINTYYSLEQAVEHIGFGKFHWKLMFLCGVGYFAEITELVVVSFVAPAIQKELNLSDFQYGLLGSSSFIGMAIGAVFWGHVGDSLGRRISFNLTVWLTFLGGFSSAFAPNYIILLALRLTAAFGIGGMLPIDYTVFLEFLPSTKRGSRIVMLDGIGVIPALTLSAAMAYAFSSDDQIAWRWVLAMSAIPSGIMAVLRRHVPESPRFYLGQNKIDEAQEVLEHVAKVNNVELPGKMLRPNLPYEEICEDASKIEDESTKNVLDYHFQIVVDKSRGSSHSCNKLFASEELGSTTWRLWLVAFLGQFSSSGMVFAIPRLLEDSFDITNKRVAEDLMWGVIGVVPGLAVAYYVIELSRKFALAGFSVVASLSTLLLAFTTLYMNNEMGTIIFSMALRGSMEGFFAALNTTGVEAYPTVFRASGLGTAQIFSDIAGILSPIIFSQMNKSDSFRAYAFGLYAAGYLAVVFPALTLPVDYAGKRVHDKL